jgi:hypothetical protein
MIALDENQNQTAPYSFLKKSQKGRTLLVGEGNLSFGKALIRLD